MIFLLFLTAVSYTAQAEGNEEGFTLQPGDILQVTVWKEEGMDREVLVLPDGTIDPKIRDEFGDKETYIAFRKAEDEGRVRRFAAK